MASRDAADRLVARAVEYVIGEVIVPAVPMWESLVPADRARVLQWTRDAHAAQTPPPTVPRVAPAFSRDPTERSEPAAPERLVSDMQAERRRAMRVRVWRDAGTFVAVAAVGARIALSVRPPLTPGTVGAALAWAVVLTLGVRYLVGRAKGRGVVGTPEGNAAYFASPERYAVGGFYSACLGAIVGIAAMVTALVTGAF